MKNEMFEQMFLSPKFQKRLILKVVDEAHLIYQWGLVASGQAKHSVSFNKHDRPPFRPHYGDLARRFLATDDVPLLLMSATCRPQARDAIMTNLKMKQKDIHMIYGEMSRPEIRMIRVPVPKPLDACVEKIVSSDSAIENSSIPPSLIYGNSQNVTLVHMDRINCARGQPHETFNARSTCCRRYHANSGPEDKLAAVDDFAAGRFPMCCCTIALGLGQNWPSVRRVFVVGRTDPSDFIQMAGRCGRDGRTGLAFLFVEIERGRGKNAVGDFKNVMEQSDDDRMDALAVTPVCLRIALAIDLK